MDGRTFAERTQGRKIEVTFADGEQMVGSTLGYRPDGTGFFVSPADGDGNNLRVFVLPGGVKRGSTRILVSRRYRVGPRIRINAPSRRAAR